jgi:type I restriction enzyme S subunit
MYKEVIHEVINRTNLNRNGLLFSNGDEILLPSAGEDPLDIGSASALTISNVAIGRTINILRPKIESLYSQIFVSYYINQKLKKKISSLAKGVSISNVYNSDLKKLSITLPPLSEQNRIAEFLSLLAERIQAQSKIIEDYKLLKKGLMKKIFKQKIRFKDKDGQELHEWEIKKLSNLCERVSRKNKEDNKNVLTISAQLGLINQEEYFNTSVSAKNVTGYYLLEKNEFAYNKSYSKGYPMGAVKRLKKYEKGVVSTLYICFEFNAEVSLEFMEQYFESGFHNHELSKVAQEGARNHGLLNIAVGDFFATKLLLPSKQEQQKIALALSAVDKKIELETSLLEQFKTQKQYFLQNLFI